MSIFDNFFAYSLAGGAAVASSNGNSNGGTDTGTGTDTTATGVPTNGLVAYWTMDETSGDRIDLVSGVSLKDINGVGSSTDAINSRAASFSSPSYLDAGVNLNTFLENSFTICFWIKCDSLPTNRQTIFAQGDHTANKMAFELNINSGGNWNFATTSNGSNRTITAITEPISNGNYEFISIVKDKNNLTQAVYKSGQLLQSDSVSNFYNNSVDPVLFGARVWNGNLQSANTFEGQIDEISIHDRVLTPQEISDIYNNGEGTTYTVDSTNTGSSGSELTVTQGLQLWLDATDASTITVSGTDVTQWNDKSGNDNHATVAIGSPQLENDAIAFDRNSAFSYTNPAFEGNAPRSIACTIQISFASEGQYFWSNGSANTNNLFSLATTGGTTGLTLTSWGSSNGAASQADVFEYDTDRWYTLITTYDGSTSKVYLDNTLIIEYNRVLATNSSQPSLIGSLPGFADRGLNGAMKDFLAYDRALDDTERTQVYDYLTRNS